MNNNKQSSVEQLINSLIKLGYLHSNEFGQSLKVTEVINQAKAMHKEEILDAHRVQYDYSYSQIDPKKVTGEQYYNETFEGSNEQAMIDYNKMEEEWEMDNYNEIKDEQQ